MSVHTLRILNPAGNELARFATNILPPLGYEIEMEFGWFIVTRCVLHTTSVANPIKQIGEVVDCFVVPKKP